MATPLLFDHSEQACSVLYPETKYHTWNYRVKMFKILIFCELTGPTKGLREPCPLYSVISVQTPQTRRNPVKFRHAGSLDMTVYIQLEESSTLRCSKGHFLLSQFLFLLGHSHTQLNCSRDCKTCTATSGHTLCPKVLSELDVSYRLYLPGISLLQECFGLNCLFWSLIESFNCINFTLYIFFV